MINQFIPYEQALALKEIGFNETCLAFYSSPYGRKINPPKLFISENCIETAAIRRVNILCLAPLYQQVFDWFRNNYGLIGNVLSYDVKLKLKFFFAIVEYDGDNKLVEEKYNCIDKWEKRLFEDHQKANIACIDKLIEIRMNTINNSNEKQNDQTHLIKTKAIS